MLVLEPNKTEFGVLRYFNTQELSFHSRSIGQQYRTFGTCLLKADNEWSWPYWGLVPESALLGGDGRECLNVYRKLSQASTFHICPMMCALVFPTR